MCKVIEDMKNKASREKSLSIARKLLVLNRLTYEEIADAVNKMEGVPVRSCVIELSNAWSEGKITGAQMKEAHLKSHMEMARRVK